MLHHIDINPERIDPTLWRNVPEEMHLSFQQTIRAAEERVTKNWESYSQEETMTGGLLMTLQGTYTQGGWVMNLEFVNFQNN